MEMSEDMLKQPGKVGNTVVEEEAVTMTKMTTTRHLHEAVEEIHVAVKAGAGSEMRKDIRKHQGKAGNIARAEDAASMMTMTTTRHLHRAAVEEAVITMSMMRITTGRRAVVAEEVAAVMMTMTIIKDLHAAVAGAAVATMRMTRTMKDLRVVVREARVAVRAEVGMEMKKGIPKQRWKVGSIVVEEAAAATMMTMTIIKDPLVGAAEIRAVVTAGVGLVMTKDIHVLPAKAGVIGIDFPKGNLRKGTLQQLLNVPFSS